MGKIEELEKKIAKLKKIKESIKSLKPIEEFTNVEKEEKFRELYNLAKKHINVLVEDGYGIQDIKQWCFEAVMEILGKDVWIIINTDWSGD